MRHTAPTPYSATRRVLMNLGRFVCLPALVLIALDLALPSQYSVVRDWISPGNRTISHDQNQDQESDADHVYFGIEDASPADESDKAVASSLGSWSGRFDASAAGESDATCWSPMSVSLNLTNTAGQITGSGSYWVDPSDCSVHRNRHQVFVTVFGTRRGGRVSLRIRDTGTGDVLMTFDGLIMPERLSGWFYSPDAKPASGPVTLKPSERFG